MKTTFITALAVLCCAYSAYSQAVGINTTNPDPSAVLDVTSNQKGVLLPRLTTSERNAIANPALGLIIYNTDSECFNIFKANGWYEVCGNCIAPPLPVITASASVCQNSNFSLTTNSVQGGTYNWSGPNGFSSTLQNPTINNIQTNGSGTYSLFVVTNGCTSLVATHALTVNPAPNGNFTFNPSTGQINVPVAFSAAGGYTYQWTFASGNPANSTAQNPSVTWTTPGTYTVNLSVISNGCTTSTTQNITVTSCPVQPIGQSQTFNYTGGVQTFTVPSCVNYIDIDVYGAQGFATGVTTFGRGGRLQARLTVTPGEVLSIYVGGTGTSTTGGWNGGGNAGSSSTYGAGGGASDIRRGGTSLNDRIAVAGGGGGTGSNCGTNSAPGGNGGDVIGGSGCTFSCSSCQYTGSGGTQSAGGIAGPTSHGSCTGNNNGAFGVGGSNTGGGGTGTGGGGGWYGGGSGCYEGAGGGSSYITTIGSSNVIHTQGVRQGNGLITISW